MSGGLPVPDVPVRDLSAGRAALPGLAAAGLIALSGLLLALCLPPWNREWLGWIALVPLLVAARGQRPLIAAGCGLLTGSVCGLVQMNGSFSGPNLLEAWLPFLWLAMLLAAVAAAGAAGGRRFQGLPWILLIACAGISGEWLTAFSPLPINLAICQFRTLPVIQVAEITGIWGVSFLLWWTNAVLTDAIVTRRARLAPWLLTGLLLAAVVGYGLVRLRAPGVVAGPLLRVAAIQEFESGDASGVSSASNPPGDREQLTRVAARRGARLIVWTEEGLGRGFDPIHPPQLRLKNGKKPVFRHLLTDPARDLARILNVYLVVGFEQAAAPKPFNSAAIVAPNGRVLGIYHKIHPFLSETMAIQAGKRARAYSTPLGRLGMEICFDTCYTGVTRQAAADGAQLIAVPNLDPPVPHGVIHRLHDAVVPFRAVENRTPIVRADPNGGSQIIAASGQIVAQAPLWTADALVANVHLGDGRGTFFTAYGDWLAYLCLAVFVALSVPFAGPPGQRLNHGDTPRPLVDRIIQ